MLRLRNRRTIADHSPQDCNMSLMSLRFADAPAASPGGNAASARPPGRGPRGPPVRARHLQRRRGRQGGVDFFSTERRFIRRIGKVVEGNGHPVAIIRGEEAGGAVALGLLMPRASSSSKGYLRTRCMAGPVIDSTWGGMRSRRSSCVRPAERPALYKRFRRRREPLLRRGFGVNYVRERHGTGAVRRRAGVWHRAQLH